MNYARYKNPNVKHKPCTKKCGTCGKEFWTSAASPWIRVVAERGDDGKTHQYTRYFCSSGCFKASYKNIGWYDGKNFERKRLRDNARNRKEDNKRYYAKNREKILQKKKENYWQSPEYYREVSKLSRKKRRLLNESSLPDGARCP